MEGMDISTFQGDVDLSAAKAGGIQVVYIRASYGQAGVDARFSQNHAAAQAAGLPFGFYHYLESETPEGVRLEAEHFAGLIASTGYTCRPDSHCRHPHRLGCHKAWPFSPGWRNSLGSAP